MIAQPSATKETPYGARWNNTRQSYFVKGQAIFDSMHSSGPSISSAHQRDNLNNDKEDFLLEIFHLLKATQLKPATAKNEQTIVGRLIASG
jgi:hypothetical protein